jgi:hypothetical protein
MGRISNGTRSRRKIMVWPPIPIDPFHKPDRVEHDYYEEEDED